WEPIEDLLFRGSWAEGFRAPSIGELFGTPSRFDQEVVDPCSGMTAGSPANIREQGSTTTWSKRDGVPNNSPMLGARKPSAQLPRNSRSSIGSQLIPALKVVVEPDVE